MSESHLLGSKKVMEAGSTADDAASEKTVR